MVKVVMMTCSGTCCENRTAFDITAAFGFGLDNGMNDIMFGKLFPKYCLKTGQICRICHNVERGVMIIAVDAADMQMVDIFHSFYFRQVTL